MLSVCFRSTRSIFHKSTRSVYSWITIPEFRSLFVIEADKRFKSKMVKNLKTREHGCGILRKQQQDARSASSNARTKFSFFFRAMRERGGRPTRVELKPTRTSAYRAVCVRSSRRLLRFVKFAELLSELCSVFFISSPSHT